MKLVLVPLLFVLWSPVSPVDPAESEVCTTAPRGLGDDAATKCKRKCNSQCAGASNKSKCVAECRRACDR